MTFFNPSQVLRLLQRRTGDARRWRRRKWQDRAVIFTSACRLLTKSREDSRTLSIVINVFENGITTLRKNGIADRLLLPTLPCSQQASRRDAQPKRNSTLMR